MPIDQKKQDELYSSAFTMSDMEIFIFPELLYAMVLANILSPCLWAWKNDPWFSEIDQLNFNKKIHRLKQFVMDNYLFNLDLETWGLTTQETELNRFKNFISPSIIAESNALFGYEGDKYYFSIDIRKHFGLDKYNSNVIPFWKTETIEAMNAFQYKEGHTMGAGECVSFSALYAAALFVVLKIPLDQIFLIATPLHSQNFINWQEGFLTNNRRIVTKKMWFNGTALSDKARRAIYNEKITYVSHLSGYIHSVYKEATIDKKKYEAFAENLNFFLKTTISGEIFANLLRSYSQYRKFFEFSFFYEGKTLYLDAGQLYKYEHNSKNRVGDKSRSKLFEEIDIEEFSLEKNSEKYLFDELELKIKEVPFCCFKPESISFWEKEFSIIPEKKNLLEDLKIFSCASAKLPNPNEKTFKSPKTNYILETTATQEEIFSTLNLARDKDLMANLAFRAGRYCRKKEWPSFLKAALERNPVSLIFFKGKQIETVYQILLNLKEHSIYGPKQFAQPDEVINFQRGDGLEKAFVLANFLYNNGSKIFKIKAQEKIILLENKEQSYKFTSQKKIKGLFQIKEDKYFFD